MTDVTQTDMAQSLREAGYRLTQPRLAVLQVLQENDEGLNPEEICRLGKAIYPSLGLVTVYRTLDLLAEFGLARRVHSEHHCHNYASAGADRHYVICQMCHRVIECPAGDGVHYHRAFAGVERLVPGLPERAGGVKALRQMRARLEGTALRSWLGIAGLWGAGLLPCPDCGAPMLLHFWPVALALTLAKLRRDKRTADTAGPVDAPDAHKTESEV